VRATEEEFRARFGVCRFVMGHAGEKIVVVVQSGHGGLNVYRTWFMDA
jgi:hypothetical protein